jgi:hypothetical protein
MSSRIIVANNPELIASEAAHFGVSVDNFISSAPAIGMEAFEIAHNGLVIVGPGNSFSRRELSTKQLFAGAYNTQGSPKIVSLNEDDDISREGWRKGTAVCYGRRCWHRYWFERFCAENTD